MNLIELAIRKKENYSYNGQEFTNLQTVLYDLFVGALEGSRRLLVPSRTLPRGCGKSTVLKKLSHVRGLPILRNGAIFQYDSEGNEMRVKGTNIREINPKAVLIDEPITLQRMDQAGAMDFVCLGYRNFEIEQSFRSLVDIETINLEVKQLRKEGKLYEYDRENQSAGNQSVYSREFSPIWGWDIIGES